MAQPTNQIIALLSVSPVYADRILSGMKQVEFRRSIFRDTVTHVVLYATSPVQRVVGFFEVNGIDEGPPSELWRRYQTTGSVNEEYFWAYYKGLARGYAIRVGRVYPLKVPVRLVDLCGIDGPPQSFRYLDSSIISELSRLSGT